MPPPYTNLYIYVDGGLLLVSHFNVFNQSECKCVKCPIRVRIAFTHKIGQVVRLYPPSI